MMLRAQCQHIQNRNRTELVRIATDLKIGTRLPHHFYHPQRGCGKVIFSQASVSHSVHGGGVCLSACWDTPPRAGTPQQVHPPGSTPSLREAHPPTVTAADCTHPTGMLSYYSCYYHKKFL